MMHFLRLAIPIAALLSACSHDTAPAPADAGLSGDGPADHERAETVSPWPDPLPACADDATPLHKGLVVGTWTPDDPDGFDHEWLDEVALRKVFTKEKARRRTWRGFTTADEIIPTDALLNDRSGAMIGYVYSLISRKPVNDAFADQPAVLHVRHRGRVRIRLDGRLVVDEPATPDGGWHEVRAAVTLTDPYDVMLAKVGRGNAELGASMDLQIRVSAPDGSAIPGQDWNTMRPPGIPSDL